MSIRSRLAFARRLRVLSGITRNASIATLPHMHVRDPVAPFLALEPPRSYLPSSPHAPLSHHRLSPHFPAQTETCSKRYPDVTIVASFQTSLHRLRLDIV